MKSLVQKIASICLLVSLFGCAVRIDEKIILPETKNTATHLSKLERQSGVLLTTMSIVTKDQIRLHGLKIIHPHSKATMLYFGGNQTTSKDKMWDLLDDAERFQVNIIMIDRRGYGHSEGRVSIAKLRQDALDVFDAVQSQTLNNIILHGHSMGSFEAVAVAEQRNIAGIILESPATFAQEWVQEYVPWYYRAFLRIKYSEDLADFNNSRSIQKITSPTLILVGSDDTSTPPVLAQNIYNNSTAKQKKIVIFEKKSHNNVREAKDYYKVISEFHEL